jgi:hypothetical protein
MLAMEDKAGTDPGSSAALSSKRHGNGVGVGQSSLTVCGQWVPKGDYQAVDA